MKVSKLSENSLLNWSKKKSNQLRQIKNRENKKFTETWLRHWFIHTIWEAMSSKKMKNTQLMMLSMSSVHFSQLALIPQRISSWWWFTTLSKILKFRKDSEPKSIKCSTLSKILHGKTWKKLSTSIAFRTKLTEFMDQQMEFSWEKLFKTPKFLAYQFSRIPQSV